MFHGLSLILLQQLGFSRRNSFKVTHRGRFEHEPAQRPPMRGGENYVDQKPRTTESAAMARLSESSKNSSGWPMNMPSATKALTVATAPPSCVDVGRMTEHRGSSLLMKLHGSGSILLVCVSSVAGLLRSGNASPVTGSTTPARGCETAFPPLSCQSPKWSISTPPMLTRIRSTVGSVALNASVG